MPNPENEEVPQTPAGVGEIREEFFRSGGKGGQNVNKVETGVRLRATITDPELLARLQEIYPGGVTKNGEFLVESTQERTQNDNLRLAQERLFDRNEEAHLGEHERIPTKGLRPAKNARLSEKRKRGETQELGRKYNW